VNPLDWLDRTLLQSSLLAWLAALTVFIVAWSALSVARRLLHKRFRVFAEPGAPTALRIAHHLISRTAAWFPLLIALLVASRFLEPTTWTSTLIPRIVTIGLLLQIGLWSTAALTMFIGLRRERQLAEDPGAVAAMDLLNFVLRLVVWAAILLLMLDNLGVNVTALVAGLGVGGIAVALAAQNILGDLFASLSIVLDKPFVVGDFLIVGDFMGSVENVGLKTTRLRSLSGEQLVFSNTDLLGSRIRNYGRMYQRRVVFSLGVIYQTPAEKLEAIPEMIRSAIEAHGSKVRFDRAHFSSLGDSALLFEAVYYVLSADFNLHMDIQQQINLTLFGRFAAEGIEFAYPTQTVFMTRARPAAPAASA
jgi:small-conductance mechanosensitive channel